MSEPQTGRHAELPTVTAIIPCHNHAAWVWDAIQSVANQSYPEKRIVVVDDGSTDNSFEAIIDRVYRPNVVQDRDMRAASGRIPNSDASIVVFRFENARGPAFARNHGIKGSWEGTDIFAFLDSDDIYEPGKIQKSVDKFLESPQLVGAVYSDYETVSPEGRRFREYKEPFSRGRLLQECIVNCDSLVSKEAIANCGLFDEELRVCEDYDLWLRISESFALIHIPESLVTIRVGHHSSTSTVDNSVWQNCMQRVMKKTHERAKDAT